ncbi:hypothetical protein CNR22_23260 [Sphingobacteriaceae bacterium]|nr:hypothetical protein CNR22_23260 [Sphingobacteriaceae bacterium]
MSNPSPKELYLKAHPLCADISFEDYCLKIPKFYFRKGVPEDVIKNFEVIEKLMIFGYYEYRFVDEAYAKALLTFEMAMSIRYKDFFPGSKDLTFNNLIGELSALNLFDLNLEGLKHLKWTRNYFAHPKHYSFAGIVFWHRVEFVSRTINEMYEDVSLRLQRNALEHTFTKNQNESNLCESLILTLDKKENILFRFKLLFINNKHSSPVYIFLCVPLFPISQKENEAAVPQIFTLQIIDPVIENNVLTAKQHKTNLEVKISSAFNLYEFETWKEEYNKVKNTIIYESGIDFMTPSLIIPEIQKFEQMD